MALLEGLIDNENLAKIESFINDRPYKDIIESAANYNTRLCIERRLRLPFLDSQTGVAQNHSSLYMNKRQRLPGVTPGQIYIYPRPRWRKRRRQYLTINTRTFARAADSLLDEVDMHNISQVENPALQDTDSKDSQLLNNEVGKEWYYDEQDILEMDVYDEPDPDSDLDYEETYNKRTKRRKGTGRSRGTDSPSTPGRRKGGGRGRRKASAHNFDPTPGDPDKPFACELCGARYKTRPGLTYHYGHSHKEGASDENSRDSNAPMASAGSVAPPPMPGGINLPINMGGPPNMGGMVTGPGPVLGEGPSGSMPPGQGIVPPGSVYQDSYVSFLNQPLAGTPIRRGRHLNNSGQPLLTQPPSSLLPNMPNHMPPHPLDDPQMPILHPEKIIDPSHSVSIMDPMKVKPMPNPYCDFCLGDARENRKTGGSEDLVSCADCGRSGHPTCLQFTTNMMVSVLKYRWQCIECKCCSVCGTSDNDDQLLFCDDCDRGYHMYCLAPPLHTPPEGSWSCKLCIDQFHS